MLAPLPGSIEDISMNHSDNTLREPFRLPHIGQRITKTAIAVFLCLLVFHLRGIQGASLSSEACITAIICMQPYVRDTREFAVNRVAGTLIGSFWGLLFLLLCLLFPDLANHRLLLYALMALGVIVSLYGAVAIRMADASSLAAIVFICIVIAFPEIESPLQQAFYRISDVLLGTFIAIGVNVFRLPRDKNRDLVFFIRTKDLVPDRFSQIPAVALFRLNYLYNDGAKICLMSEHAPAFFTLQMGGTHLSVPLIVMDGAAIYDANENRYLCHWNIPAETSGKVREYLDNLGLSYFIYTIHNNKTCIFHQGKMNEQEKKVYDRMRTSPYRSYLDGEIYKDEELVYFKIIDEDDKIKVLRMRMQKMLRENKLRSVIRPQTAAPGISGLYIYSMDANNRRAELKLMQMLHEKEPQLEDMRVFLPGSYRTESDAVHLLHTVLNYYEPLKIMRLFKRKDKKGKM